MNQCPRCKQQAELCSSFKTGASLAACCAKCAEELAKKRAYMKEWKSKNADKNRTWSRNWASNNPEKVKARLKRPDVRQAAVERVRQWRQKRPDIASYRAAEARKYRASDREKSRAYRRRHYEANKERLSLYRSNYIKANPGFNRAAAARHRALMLQRTVAWADLAAIKEFYKNCPPDMVVDHIIPLRGKNVCGLHVLSNLQYLTDAENSRKSNRFDYAA